MTTQQEELADRGNRLNYRAEMLGYEVDSSDLDAAIEDGDDVIIVDTRSPEAFRREHVVDVINLPHRSINPETTAHLYEEALPVTHCDGIGRTASTKGIQSRRVGFSGGRTRRRADLVEA